MLEPAKVSKRLTSGSAAPCEPTPLHVGCCEDAPPIPPSGRGLQRPAALSAVPGQQDGSPTPT